MKTEINFKIANTKTVITLTTYFKGHKTEQSMIVLNDGLQFTVNNYVKADCMLTMATSKAGNKAADMLFLLVRKVESAFNIVSDWANGEYLAVIETPKFNVI